jgi:hypothetical protein
MKYIAYLISENKIVDTIEMRTNDKKEATRTFYEYGHKELLASDNYNIDIFEGDGE